MSRYLAPIHTWLFNKIRVHEELEQRSLSAFKNKYGDDLNNIEKSAYSKYGDPLENKPLEELIDTSNIHGWLQNRIEITETRQSYILAEVLKQHGEEALHIALDVYASQGSDCGNDAKDNFDVSGAAQIYQALNNFILDGMPCDNVNSVTFKSDEKLVWKNSQCLHKGYWENAGADLNILYKLRYTWIKSFIENANNSFTFIENTEEANGIITFVHEIIKK